MQTKTNISKDKSFELKEKGCVFIKKNILTKFLIFDINPSGILADFLSDDCMNFL